MTTVKEYCDWLTGGLPPDQVATMVSEWPPDAFALVNSILHASGAYRFAVSPPEDKVWPPWLHWRGKAERWGVNWKGWCDEPAAKRVPLRDLRRIARYFLRLLQSEATLEEIGDGKWWEDVLLLLTLNATADVACAGLGIARGRHHQDHPRYIFDAHALLTTTGSLSHFRKDRVRVLPKMRVPQTGITIRSLSHHVAVVGGAVDVRWITTNFSGFPHQRANNGFNLLVVPWPYRVARSAFRAVESDRASIEMRESKFGFFTFDPEPATDDLKREVERILEFAKTSCEKVDALVLPELAVSKPECDELWEIARRYEVPMLLAGVREPSRNFARRAIRRWCGGCPSTRRRHPHTQPELPGRVTRVARVSWRE